MKELTLSHLKIMEICLSISIIKRMLWRKKAGKKLPNEFIINYCTHIDSPEFTQLVEWGYMVNHRDDKYCVTKMGYEKFKETVDPIVKYERLTDRDLNYLKRRIDFYCDYYGYRFSKDNYNNILTAFWKFKNGIGVSEIMENICRLFEAEINWICYGEKYRPFF